MYSTAVTPWICCCGFAQDVFELIVGDLAVEYLLQTLQMLHMLRKDTIVDVYISNHSVCRFCCF
jgi:hypothetical protein